jgi:hypothetical protein
LAFESGNIPKETLDYLASKSQPKLSRAEISEGKKVFIFALLIFCIPLVVIAFISDSPKEAKAANAAATQPTATITPYQPKELITEAEKDMAMGDDSGALAVIAKLQDSDLKRPAVQSMFKRATREVKVADAAAVRIVRLAYAENYEKQLLASGYDYVVRAQGPNADTLSVTFVLVNRPFVYNIENDADLNKQWSSLGFKKVRLGDGFDSSWSYSLK